MSMSPQNHEDLAAAIGTATTVSELVAKVAAVCLDDDPNFQPEEFWEQVIAHQLVTLELLERTARLTQAGPLQPALAEDAR